MSLKGTKTKENLEAAFAGEVKQIEDIFILLKKQTSKVTMMLHQYLDQQQKVKQAMRMDT